MLNFLQTALNGGVEITSDNFKAFVAQNSVATSSNENYFEIYQLKKDENLRYHRFTDYETLHKEGNTVEAENYIQVYRDELSSGTTLEDIYTRFNINQPADFKGHSLSVSDIIVVHDNGDTAAYYIDDVGYKRVPEFLKLEQKAENIVTNSNEETAVVTNSNEEQAIHSGFASLYANHNYTDKQKQFLERLEKFAARNNVTENIIDVAFERMTAFHNTYDADKTKNNPGINVIIGNPPYSGISSNNNEYITKLIDDYKYIEGEYFNERKHWLNDDYVKFIRYAEEVISKNGNGILAFINNNGFLENPTFRCMRYHLMRSFDSIYIINLHGDITKDKVTIDNNKEENVFDITKGVSINIFVKNSLHNTNCSKLFYKDIYGTRERKYQLLDSDIQYQELFPVKPYYLFVPTTISTDNIYYSGINIDVLFSKNTTGIVTMADEFLVTDLESEIQQHIIDFIQNDYSKESFKDKYNLGKNYPDFVLDSKGKIVFDKGKIIPISYRPFDNKYTYYDRLLIWRARDEISPQFFKGNNIGLITARSNKSDDCSHFYISRYMSEAKCGERTTQSAIFPLYLYSGELGKTVRTPNLNSEIVKEISDKLGLPFAPDSDGGRTDSFAPIDLLDYIYAVLYSPKYRETYKEFLKIDFPRVPYPTDKEMFWKMVKLGGEIRKLHLMESPLLDTLITRFPLNGSNEVEKITRKENRVYINKTQYFEGISDLTWNFYIGGYQPLQKWLKDRKGRTLSDEDIIHYQKIAVALTETDRLMKEIDEVFIFGEDAENVKA